VDVQRQAESIRVVYGWLIEREMREMCGARVVLNIFADFVQCFHMLVRVVVAKDCGVCDVTAMSVHGLLV